MNLDEILTRHRWHLANSNYLRCRFPFMIKWDVQEEGMREVRLRRMRRRGRIGSHAVQRTQSKAYPWMPLDLVVPRKWLSMVVLIWKFKFPCDISTTTTFVLCLIPSVLSMINPKRVLWFVVKIDVLKARSHYVGIPLSKKFMINSKSLIYSYYILQIYVDICIYNAR